MDINREYIIKIFKGLPENLQDFIISENTAKNIYDVGKKNNLSINQIIDISVLIGDVLFGLRPLEKFLTDLKEELKLDNEKTITIASEINQKIFFPFKETIRNVYQSTQKEIEPILKKEKKAEKKEEVPKKAIQKITKTITKGVSAAPRVTPPPIRTSQPSAEQKAAPKPPEISKTPQPSQQPAPSTNSGQVPKTAELRKDILEELTK